MHENAQTFVRTIDVEAELARAQNPLEVLFFAHAGRVTDKWPHYLAIYHRYLQRFRGSAVRLLEIGVQNGGSLQIWRRYFGEQAVIHGLDRDPRCASIDDPDLTVHIGDQSDQGAVREAIERMGGIDVLIDDGSHKSSDQIGTFETVFPLASDGAVLIVEDLHTSYWPAFGGGGDDSFIAHMKRQVDRLHAHYTDDADRSFADNCGGIHFHDSIVVVEKLKRSAPYRCTVGTAAIT